MYFLYSKSVFELCLGAPVAFQPLLKRIHALSQLIRLHLIVVDSLVAVSIEPEFPLRSKSFILMIGKSVFPMLYSGILFYSADLFS